ncbi:SEC-C metal-binding domain-containing protein [Micromonospora zamorensis]
MDPCPCGSGRRLRRCCRAKGRFDDTNVTTTYGADDSF